MIGNAVGYVLTEQAVEQDGAGWGRLARWSGAVAGSTLFAGAVLLLLDNLNILAPSPVFHPSSAGPEADVANWYAAFFARQHHIVWDIAIRESLGPVTMVALVVLVLTAVRYLDRWTRPEVVLMVVVTTAGALLAMLSNLVYLGEVGYWRHGGWSADPSLPMFVDGRVSQGAMFVATYLEAAGDVLLAVGIVLLGRMCRRSDRVPGWLPAVAYLEAAAILVYVVGNLVPSDTLLNVGGLAAGILLGPALLIGLGRALPVS